MRPGVKEEKQEELNSDDQQDGATTAVTTDRRDRRGTARSFRRNFRWSEEGISDCKQGAGS